MTFFYKQYFISLAIGSGAALVSLLCIFFVSKEGWEKTNNALINVGVTSFVTTLFFLNTSQIFQHSENLKVSQDLYANYTTLNNQLRSSLSSGVIGNFCVLFPSLILSNSGVDVQPGFYSR
ncbi:hypothetical protein [Merismopedia glauca]|uniref:Uncharacterized protein n=1 Tax=Merismopedia glauca CCAP 1448/3 TaxID=1296344 RepID=A0A2T1C059_9CYAN|nr:hypothetical protein [Merismopedia glauca]PSB01557.1 hypothetical protein C7B64_17630 [Merismopedia glauca CCAP 1448/3]